MQKKLIALVGALALAGSFAACAESTGPSTGRVVVQLTDAPFPYDSVESVDIYVVRVDAKQQDVDDDEIETEELDEENEGGWVTLATPNELIDLLELQNGVVTTLGEETIAVGNWQSFRLIIDPSQSSITLKDGTVLSGANGGVSFPSAARSGLKVRLMEPIVVTANDTQVILLDFDVSESFVMRGNSVKNNGFNFTPVIKATVSTED